MILSMKQFEQVDQILKNYGAVCSDDDYMGKSGVEARYQARGDVEKVVEDFKDGENERDMRSLKEMQACVTKLKDGFDIVQVGHLETLVEDWIDEIKAKR
jgi:hypothetical protein